MDTRTGQIVNLSESEAIAAQQEWRAWEAGLLKIKPKYAPIKQDRTPVMPETQRRRRRKATPRSYKDFCNG